MARFWRYLVSIIMAVGLAFLAALLQGAVLRVQAVTDGNVVVTPTEISFAAVFPQETLISKELTLGPSEQFNNQSQLNHIYYTLFQFPQPKADPEETITVDAPYFFSGSRQNFCRFFSPASASLDDPYYQHCKPILCPYISKKKGPSDNPAELGGDESVPLSQRDPNLDYELNAPHSPFAPPAQGHFARNFDDFWQFDLVVPCFEGQCAQVYSFTQFGPPLPPAFMGQEFGCDVEVVVTAATPNQL